MGQSEIFNARIINGGRITIPEIVRAKLDLAEGEIVEVSVRKTT
jgi:AbrB family looped-hinge helix DNA binding protein